MYQRALLTIVVLAGCSGPRQPAADGRSAGTSFTGRPWVRTDSTGLPGVIRAFFDDGTLLMGSCWEVYRLARWERIADTAVRWNEDGMDIDATLRQVSHDSLELTVHLHDGTTDSQHYRSASVPYVCPEMRR